MCNHEKIETLVSLEKLTVADAGPIVGWSADIQIRCVDCGEPFVFLAPSGFSFAHPTVSLDGYTLRAPLGPASSTSAPIDLLIPTGVDA